MEREVPFCFADLQMAALAFKGVDINEGSSLYVEVIEVDGESTISSLTSGGSEFTRLLSLFLNFISIVATLIFDLDSAFFPSMVKICFRWSAGLTSNLTVDFWVECSLTSNPVSHTGTHYGATLPPQLFFVV